MNRASKRSNSSPRFEFTSERPHYLLASFSSFICTCTTSKKQNLHQKGPSVTFRKNFRDMLITGYRNEVILRTECHAITLCDVVMPRVSEYRKRKAAILLNNRRGKNSSSSDGETPIISIFRKFLRKVIESSFKCKFIFFASCARANET